MSNKKKFAMILMALFVVMLNVAILTHKAPESGPVQLHMFVQADLTDDIKVYYSQTKAYADLMSDTVRYQNQYPNGTMDEEKELVFTIDSSATNLRFDFGVQAGTYLVRELNIMYRDTVLNIPLESLCSGDYHDIERCVIETGTEGEKFLKIQTEDDDPYLCIPLDQTTISDQFQERAALVNRIKIVAVAIILDLACLILFRVRKKLMELPVELFHNRRMIFSLARNDFKTKYAGSYLGIVWAFVQPVVTVLVYWFVFQVGLKSPGPNDFPFVLWMIAGLVPWFFFSDVLNAGTNALIEYSYLVKKVVFKISILPIVKVISALFVHLFFIAFSVFLFAVMGKLPPVHIIQIVYYSMALICLVVALSYLTCSIMPFFRDFSQIINVILNIGMWATPILWDKTTIPNIPGWLDNILKLNPLYYIVQGYRDSFMNGVWFFEHPWHTLYFWVFVLVIGLVGSKVFKRLRVHFSDVL